MLHHRAHPVQDRNNRHQRPRSAQALVKAGMPAPVRPGHDWTVVLRRQPVRLVDGQPQGGYTDEFELICCDCGDDPDLDYHHVPPGLQQIRGPYSIAAGIAAYEKHIRRHRQQVTNAGFAGQARGAVPGLLLVRFPGPPAEPAVRLSAQRALRGLYRQVVAAAQGLGILFAR